MFPMCLCWYEKSVRSKKKLIAETRRIVKAAMTSSALCSTSNSSVRIFDARHYHQSSLSISRFSTFSMMVCNCLIYMSYVVGAHTWHVRWTCDALEKYLGANLFRSWNEKWIQNKFEMRTTNQCLLCKKSKNLFFYTLKNPSVSTFYYSRSEGFNPWPPLTFFWTNSADNKFEQNRGKMIVIQTSSLVVESRLLSRRKWQVKHICKHWEPSSSDIRTKIHIH